MSTPTCSVDLCVRVGREPTEELRYTIRSLTAHLPHARLVTFGAPVPWLTCEHVDVEQPPSKMAGAYAVLRAILAADLTPSVIIADDDMFLMRALDGLPEYHRGPLGEVDPGKRRPGWADTLALVPDALCRDAHVPTLVDRQSLTAILDGADLPPDQAVGLWWRTLCGGGDTLVGDAKRTTEGDWLSSHAATWNGTLGQKIRAAFAEPCQWER